MPRRSRGTMKPKNPYMKKKKKKKGGRKRG